jgi:hypothetical protein
VIGAVAVAYGYVPGLGDEGSQPSGSTLVEATFLLPSAFFVALAVSNYVYRSGLSVTVAEGGLSIERRGREVHRYPWVGATPPIQIRDPRVPQSVSTSDSVVPVRTPPDPARLRLGASGSSGIQLTDAAYDAIIEKVTETGGRIERSIDVVQHRKTRSYYLMLTVE